MDSVEISVEEYIKPELFMKLQSRLKIDYHVL